MAEQQRLSAAQTKKKEARSNRAKQRYNDYINSAEWQAKRQEYIAAVKPTECAACKKPWGSGDHLHHMTYERMGDELLDDLIHLCPGCHELVHKTHGPGSKRLMYVTHLVIQREGRPV